MTICRELTKKHEEIFVGSVSEAIDHFQQPRGEITIVIKSDGENPNQTLTENKEAELILKKTHGKKARDAVTEIAAIANVSRKEAYRIWLKHKNDEK